MTTQETPSTEGMTVELEEMEAIKGMSIFERASTYMYLAGKRMIEGNMQSFVTGMALVENTLLPKLEKLSKEQKKQNKENKDNEKTQEIRGAYFKAVNDKRSELGIEDDPSNMEKKVELALFKCGELNRFIDRHTPFPVRGVMA